MNQTISISNTEPSGIVFDSVSFQRNGKPILTSLCFQAKPGEISVLFGPSGAGKTTCLRLIAGFEKPSAGRIFLDGQKVSSTSIVLHPSKRRIGFCFQDDALWSNISVRDHLSIPMCERGINGDLDRRCRELLTEFGMNALADRYPSQLSGGERKRLALARALSTDPAFLLLDEPLSSVEGPLREDLMRRLQTCRREGRTVAIVTHQLDEAFAMGGVLIVLDRGSVLQQGPIRDVFLHPHSRQTAELLGYRNFFSIQKESGRFVTPFGPIDIESSFDETALAACLPGDLETVADKAGQGIVESCHPENRVYRVRVRFKESIYETQSPSCLQLGENATIRLINPPVTIGKAT